MIPTVEPYTAAIVALSTMLGTMAALYRHDFLRKVRGLKDAHEKRDRREDVSNEVILRNAVAFEANTRATEQQTRAIEKLTDAVKNLDERTHEDALALANAISKGRR